MASGFEGFMQMFLRSLETGSVFALMALAIIIIFRTSAFMHFAQGTMSMFNTYIVAYMLRSHGVSLLVAILLGICGSLVAAFLVDFIVIRRAKKAPGVSKQIITLGLIMVFMGLVPIIFGVDMMRIPRIIQAGSFTVFGASISHNAVFNIVFGLTVMAILFYVLMNTKLGLAVRATASNEPIARLMGVPTRKITLFAWMTAGLLGLFAGIMIAPAMTVTTTMMVPVQLNALIACVLGGFGTFFGPVVAAYLIAIAFNMTAYYVSSVWAWQIIYGAILIFLVFRPNGLFGKRFVKKV